MTAALTPASIADIRSWTADHITNVISNRPALYQATQDAIHAALRAKYTRAQFTALPATGESRTLWQARFTVGTAVVDTLRAWITTAATEHRDTATGDLIYLLDELLDLSDNHQAVMIGATVMPEDTDWWPAPGWEVTRDGQPVSPLLPDEDAAERWLQRHQAFSNDWAKRHEGYAIRQITA